MADEIVVTFKIDEAGGVTKTGGGGAGGLFSGLGGGAAILGPLAALGTAAGIMGMLLKTNKGLQATLNAIFKLIGLIVRPITDMLRIALMPILYVLKPIGLFFRTIMRPYLKKAMELMRAGGKQLKAGDALGAMETFAQAGATMLGGFGEIFISAGKFIVQGIIEGIFGMTDALVVIYGDLMSGFILVLDQMTGGIFNLKETVLPTWKAMVEGTRESLKEVKSGIMDTVTIVFAGAITQWRNGIIDTADATVEAVNKMIEARDRLRERGGLVGLDKAFSETSGFSMIGRMTGMLERGPPIGSMFASAIRQGVNNELGA